MAASGGERWPLKGVLPAVPRHGKVTEVLPKVLVATWPETAPQRRPLAPGVRQKQKILPKPIRASTFADAVPLSSKNYKVPPAVAKLQTVLHQQDAPKQPLAGSSTLTVGGDRGKYDLPLALKLVVDVDSSFQDDNLLASYTNSIWDFNASYSMLGDPAQPAPSRMSASAFSIDGPSPAQASITDRDLQGRASASRMSEGPPPSRGSLTARESQRSVRGRSCLDSRGDTSLLQTFGSHRPRANTSIRPAADSVRLRHLQQSFHRTCDEVLKKLAELEEHPRWDIVMDNVSDTGTPQSTPSRSASTVLRVTVAHDSDSEASDHEKTQEPKQLDDTFPAIKELFATSYLGVTAPQARPPLPLDVREDAGVPKIKVAQEELLRAKRLLNVYRWFCGLSPVELHQDKIDACRLLNDALLSRPEVWVRQSNAHVESLTDLGTRLGAFMAKNGRCMILHKDGSLISAVSVAVSSSHTAGWSCTSTPSPGLASQRASESHQDLLRLQQEVNLRADRYVHWCESQEKTYVGGSMDQTVFGTVDMRNWRRVTLDNFPPQLEGYKIFWLLSKSQESVAVGIDKKHSLKTRRALGRARENEMYAPAQELDQRPGTSGTIGQRHGRRLQPDRSRPSTSLGAAAKTRQMVWDEDETNRRKEWGRACNLSWGDTANTVAFRRQFLYPQLQNIGASRIHDTCIFWVEATTEEDEDEEGLDPHDDRRKSTFVGIDGFNEMHLPSLLENKSLTLEASQVVEADPSFVSFPPHGLCPMELLDGSDVPTWTIMPNSKMFQPTDELQVRMWRVKLIRETRPDENLKGRRTSAPFLPTPIDVQRVQELTLTSVTCDCSATGNPFCIIFRPEISRVWEGDQFEVELLGLRGEEQTRSFFYDFQSLLSDPQDYGMLQAAKTFREMLDDGENYRELQGVARGGRVAPRRQRDSGEALGSRAGFHDGDRAGAYSVLPDLGLVSHPNSYIAADQSIITICVECEDAVALEAHLVQLRAAGNTPVKRAVLVIKMDSYFYIRIKLPCSFSLFEVSFHIASIQNPESLQEHPFRYQIASSESCQCPLSSIDHPLFTRFGFCQQPAAAQRFGITVIDPINYAVRAGRVYFMVHINPKFATPQVRAEPTGSMPTSLLFKQIQENAVLAEDKAIQRGIIGRPDPFFSETASSPFEEMPKSTCRQELPKGVERTQTNETQTDSTTGRTSRHGRSGSKVAPEPMVGAVRRMHHQLEKALAGNTQDASGILHFDLCVAQAEPYNERYVGRLYQKPGYPEIYDGYLYLTDQDVGSNVELFLRLTRGEGSKNAALKVGEWTVGYHNEQLPPGI